MRVFPKAQPEVRTASAEAGLDYGDDTLGDSDGKSPGFSIKNGDFPIQNGDFPIQNGDFPIKHGDFPIKNGDFPIKNGDFPMNSMVIFHSLVIAMMAHRNRWFTY